VCYESGIAVPRQLSVIGCGDRAESAYLCPTLTTLAFDPRDRAHGLVDILEKRFEGDRSVRLQRLFEPKLIRRNSTSPLQ
jgi:DNA-binding LacI/PurR family transcriptional regulator